MRRSLLVLAVVVCLSPEVWATLPGILWHRLAVGQQGESVTSDVLLFVPNGEVSAVSFGMAHDGAVATLSSIELGSSVTSPEFFAVDLAPAGGTGGTVDLVVSSDGSVTLEGSSQVALFTYDILAGAPLGFSDRDFTSDLGDPAVPVDLDYTGSPGTVVDPLTFATGIAVEDGPFSPPGFGVIWFPGQLADNVSGLLLGGSVGVTTGTGPGDAPAAIAVDPLGVIWTAYTDSDTVQQFGVDGSFVQSIPVGDAPGGIALTPDGECWVSNSGDGTLTKIGLDGTIIYGGDGVDPAGPEDGTEGPAASTGDGPLGLGVDALSNVYVANRDADRLSKHGPDGALSWTIPFEEGDEPYDVAIDREGYVWVSLFGADRIDRRASDGSWVESWEIPGAGPKAIICRGQDQAWVIAATQDIIYRLDPGESPVPFDITNMPSGLAVDGEGQLWVTDFDANLAIRFDVDGNILSTTVISSGPRFLGDASGYVFPNVLRPEQDEDFDTYPSGLEIDTGANPFVTDDVPPIIPTFVDPVDDFACEQSSEGIVLTWDLPGAAFDEIEIYRDGGLLTTLPGDATSYEELEELPLGPYVYEVFGLTGGIPGLSVGCVLVVGPGMLQGAVALEFEGVVINPFDLAANPFGEDGVEYYITDSAKDSIYVADSQFVIQNTIPSPFAGIAPTTGIAFDDEGDEGLGSLFVAAGGTGDPDQISTIQEISLLGELLGDPIELFFSTPTFEGSDNVTGGLSGLDYHTPSKTLLAIDPLVCELFVATGRSADVSVGGTLEVGEVFLTAPHPNPGPGLNGVYIADFTTFEETGGPVWITSRDGQGRFIIEQVMLTDGEATQTGQAIPLSTASDENSFGGFDLARDSIRIAGVTTGVVYQLQSGYFNRGDIDGNGYDVGDSIQILCALYQDVPLRSCVDAYDTNDDGLIDMADPIFLLSWLFQFGPAFPAPFLEFGPDPTPDDLPCL